MPLVFGEVWCAAQWARLCWCLCLYSLFFCDSGYFSVYFCVVNNYYGQTSGSQLSCDKNIQPTLPKKNNNNELKEIIL